MADLYKEEVLRRFESGDIDEPTTRELLAKHYTEPSAPEESTAYKAGKFVSDVGLAPMVETVLPYARGAVSGAEQFARAIRLDDQDGARARVLTPAIESLQAFREASQPEGPAKGLRGAVEGGIESAVSSVMGGAPGALVGTVGGPAGTVGGFAAGAGTVFGLAEYDRFMEEARKQGVATDRLDDAHKAAIKSAIAEGAFEAASDLLTAGVFGKAAGAGLKGAAAAYLKAAPGEVGSEMATAAYQAKLKQGLGMETEAPLGAAKATIGPSLVTTAILGGGAQAASSAMSGNRSEMIAAAKQYGVSGAERFDNKQLKTILDAQAKEEASPAPTTQPAAPAEPVSTGVPPVATSAANMPRAELLAKARELGAVKPEQWAQEDLIAVVDGLQSREEVSADERRNEAGNERVPDADAQGRQEGQVVREGAAVPAIPEGGAVPEMPPQFAVKPERKPLIDNIASYQIRSIDELASMSDDKLQELSDYLDKREQEGTIKRAGAGPTDLSRFKVGEEGETGVAQRQTEEMAIADPPTARIFRPGDVVRGNRTVRAVRRAPAPSGSPSNIRFFEYDYTTPDGKSASAVMAESGMAEIMRRKKHTRRSGSIDAEIVDEPLALKEAPNVPVREESRPVDAAPGRFLGSVPQPEAPAPQGGEGLAARDAEDFEAESALHAAIKDSGLAPERIAQIRVVKPRDTRQTKVVDAINRLTKRQVSYVSGAPFNGVKIAGNRIYIAEDATAPLLKIFGHELAHTGGAVASGRYIGALQRAADHKQFMAFAERENATRTKLGLKFLDESAAWEEFGSDFLGEQMATPDFWERLAKQDRNVFVKVARWVAEKLRELGVPVGSMDRYFTRPGAMAEAVQAAERYLGEMGEGSGGKPGSDFMVEAHHGGPHRIERAKGGTEGGFSLGKAGTGEGAAAYGWGAYFASLKDVAGQYRKGLSYKALVQKFRNEIPDDASPEELSDAIDQGAFSDGEKELFHALQEDDWLGFDYPSQAITAALKDGLGNFDASPRLQKAVENLGYLYRAELDVNDEDLLDWDKPLSEQSEKVKKALARISGEISLLRLMDKSGKATGNWIYRAIGSHLRAIGQAGGDAQRESSEWLASIGIPGIRYLDGGSRGKGDGTHNYVIFDDKLIKLTHRNDEPMFSIPPETLSSTPLPTSELQGQRDADGKMVPDIATSKKVPGTMRENFNRADMTPEMREFVRKQVEDMPLEEWDEYAHKLSNKQAYAFAMARFAVEGPNAWKGVSPSTLAKQQQAAIILGQVAYSAQAAAFDAANKANAPGATDEDRIELDIAMKDMMALNLKHRGLGTHGSRLLQQRKILRQQIKMLKTMSLDAKQRLMLSLEEQGLMLTPDEIARMSAIPSEDHIGAVKFFQKALADRNKFTVGNWLDAYRYFNMLSGTNTHWFNLIGNSANVFVVDPMRQLAETTFSSSRTYRDLFAYYGGLTKGLGQSTLNAVQVLRYGISEQEAQRATLDLEGYGQSREAPGGNKNILNWTTRALRAGDVLFKDAAYQGALYQLAYRKLGKGATAEKVQALVESGDLHQEAFDQASKVVFQDKHDEMLMGLERVFNVGQKQIGFRPLRVAVPFLRIIYNIGKQGLSMTPGVGALQLAGKDARATGKARIAAEQAMGAALAIGAYQLAAAGLLTGGPPDGDDEREKWYTDHQPYSVKIGGKWVRWNRLGPLAFPFAVGMALQQYAENGGKPGKSMTVTISTNLGKMFFDMTMMRSFGDLISAMKDPVANTKNLASTYIGQFIPAASQLRQWNKAFDPTLRDPETWYQSLIKDVPGAAKYVPAKVNALGQEDKRAGGGWEAFFPVISDNADADLAIKELDRLNMDYPSYAKDYAEPDKMSAEEIALKEQRIGRGLTEKEMRMPRKVGLSESRERKRAIGGEVHAAVIRTIGGEAYQRMNDTQRAKVLERVIKNAYTIGGRKWKKTHR